MTPARSCDGSVCSTSTSTSPTPWAISRCGRAIASAFPPSRLDRGPWHVERRAAGGPPGLRPDGLRRARRARARPRRDGHRGPARPRRSHRARPPDGQPPGHGRELARRRPCDRGHPRRAGAAGAAPAWPALSSARLIARASRPGGARRRAARDLAAPARRAAPARADAATSPSAGARSPAPGSSCRSRSPTGRSAASWAPGGQPCRSALAELARDCALVRRDDGSLAAWRSFYPPLPRAADRAAARHRGGRPDHADRAERSAVRGPASARRRACWPSAASVPARRAQSTACAARPCSSARGSRERAARIRAERQAARRAA